MKWLPKVLRQFFLRYDSFCQLSKPIIQRPRSKAG